MYEYECTKCGHHFELIQKFSDRPKVKCPKCGGSLRKLLSAPAIHFKGSGWYVTDYGRKGAASGSGKPPEGSSSEDKGSGKSDSKGKGEEKKPSRDGAPGREKKS